MILGNQIPYLSFTIYKDLPVKAVVSTRKGGTSPAPYDSMNMGLHTGDSPENVLENRRRFFEELGIPAGNLINCRQVHGTHIEIVTKKDCGRGALSLESSIPGTDGLITEEPDVPLTMNYADCTPLFFYDPLRKVIGLSHGGWRGTAGNIVGKTVNLMVEKFGCDPKDILGAIGPAIGFENFEVGEEVVEAMRSLFTPSEFKNLYKTKPNGKYLFALAEANHVLMKKAGLSENHIEDCHLCTWDRTDLFYSYRKDHGDTGRHMAVLMMES